MVKRVAGEERTQRNSSIDSSVTPVPEPFEGVPSFVLRTCCCVIQMWPHFSKPVNTYKPEQVKLSQMIFQIKHGHRAFHRLLIPFRRE